MLDQIRFTIARYPSSYSPASTAESMIESTSSGSGATPAAERCVKMLMRAFTSANGSPTRRATSIARSAVPIDSGCCFSIWIWERRASARASCGDSGSPSSALTASVADLSASSQRPESQETRERTPSASERSWASSGPSLASAASRCSKTRSSAASVMSSRASAISTSARSGPSTASSDAFSRRVRAAAKAPRP